MTDLSFLLRRALINPDRVLPYVRFNLKKSLWLLRNGRTSKTIGYLAELLTGENTHLNAVRTSSDSQFIDLKVRGQSILVDGADPGISRTLLAYGTHEQHSTDAFIKAIEDVTEDVHGRITVLDIGANIGYFTLIEGSVVGTRGRIHALEPHPKNMDLLEKNITCNGFDGIVDTYRCAVGGESEIVPLYLNRRANRHTTWAPPKTENKGFTTARQESSSLPDRESISVEQTSVERLLSDQRISPNAVNVVRMDVEGYEGAIFRGMQSVLEATSPLVLYVEFHPKRLSEVELDEIITQLDKNGFEILSAVASDEVPGIPPQARWHGKPLDIESFDRLHRVLLEKEWWIELVARR